jgi:hypothetical protein
MRDFIILISQLLSIAIIQIIITTSLDENGQKWLIKIINIACISICYLLLIRYVYNLYAGEFITFFNFF